ncbi:WAT1-related protein At3g18200-like [Vicia villosa]|uniref:WAT1-related protein At3g18200-like n=1 Tax=Vicia villosa TaxID=3911 RepID=UPI00273C9354|nr:WAT1-related protein At3g18200-like [Vicia villosa]
MTNIIREKLKLIVGLLVLQFCFAGFHIVSRLALNIGVSKVVYAIYRNFIALILLTPFAYFLEKNQRPPLTLSLLVQFFLLALLGITANEGCYLLGMYYASPTLASAMQNSVLAITFIFASTLRLEETNIARREGIAKVVGTISSIGGAIIITLYKGPPLLHLQMNQIQLDESSTKNKNWTWGCIFLLGHCLSWAGWIVFQDPVVKKYPAKLTMTSFSCFFGLIQFLIISIFTEKDFEKWKIQSVEELSTILYAGIVASGVMLSLQTWCIQKGGPVFVAVFQPLQTFLVILMAALILGDHLYSGGIIGAIFIVLGLYLVLWGKANENKVIEPSITRPLLDSDEENNITHTPSKDLS